MIRRSHIIIACAAAAVAWFWLGGFRDERQLRSPITIREGIVVVENRTRHEWRNVVVTVNHHFRGGTTRLSAGGRLDAPLSQFATSYGQRYERSRQSVFRVEVSATDAAGEPVYLEWEATK